MSKEQSSLNTVCQRVAGGDSWIDESLADWEPNDYRIFCGDLALETTEERLLEPFKIYASVQRVKIVRDSKTGRSKGYGFVSFRDGKDYLRALKEVQGKWICNRPIKLSKSTWKERLANNSTKSAILKKELKRMSKS